MKRIAPILITLLLLALIGTGAYYLYKKFAKRKEKEELPPEEREKQMNRFNRVLDNWIRDIKKAWQSPTPGWEAWYDSIQEDADKKLGNIYKADPDKPGKPLKDSKGNPIKMTREEIIASMTTDRAAKDAALYQIMINQKDIIPVGYEIGRKEGHFELMEI
jgi:hypothetical protein